MTKVNCQMSQPPSWPAQTSPSKTTEEKEPRNSYTNEEKVDAVKKAMKAKIGIAATARNLDIHQNTLSNWYSDPYIRRIAQLQLEREKSYDQLNRRPTSSKSKVKATSSQLASTNSANDLGNFPKMNIPGNYGNHMGSSAAPSKKLADFSQMSREEILIEGFRMFIAALDRE